MTLSVGLFMSLFSVLSAAPKQYEVCVLVTWGGEYVCVHIKGRLTVV